MRGDWPSILDGSDARCSARAIRALLAPATLPYGAVVALRNRRYDAVADASTPLGRPTVSVGNLTTGGTGKTPMVMTLVRMLQAQGRHPAVLLRGYAGRPVTDGSNDPPDGPPPPRFDSDEAREYRAAFGPGVPVAADPDRMRSARWLIARYPWVDVFVLDDGFQHRRVRRDLDLVLIDATSPFGGDRLLPAGLLREPVSGLRRADGVIVTRADQVSAEQLRLIGDRIQSVIGPSPIAHARHAWTGWRTTASSPAERHERQPSSPSASERPPDALASKRVLVVSAIGRPGPFTDMVHAHGALVVDVVAHRDHHPYKAGDVRRIREQADRLGVDAIVMTGKDWVKWDQVDHPAADAIAVYRPILTMAWLDGEERIDAELRRVAPAA